MTKTDTQELPQGLFERKRKRKRKQRYGLHFFLFVSKNGRKRRRENDVSTPREAVDLRPRYPPARGPLRRQQQLKVSIYLQLPQFNENKRNQLPGRTQPSYVTVSPEGVVTWRVELRVDLFSTLDLSSFPFDIQTLGKKNVFFSFCVSIVLDGNVEG